MRREVQKVKLWAATLDLKVAAGEEEAKKQELFGMIRRRMPSGLRYIRSETARIQQQADGGQ